MLVFSHVIKKNLLQCTEPEGSLQYSKYLLLTPVLSQMNPVHSHPVSLRSNLKFPTAYVKVSCIVSLLGVLPLKHNTFLVYPVHAIWSFSLCSFLQPATTSPIRSRAASFSSSCFVREHVSHPYKTTANTLIIYVLIFMFLY
jgi:hypothetical protein